MTLSRAYAYIIIACLLWIAVMAYLTVAIVQTAQPVAPEVVVIEAVREKPEVTYFAPGEVFPVEATVASWYGPGFVGNPTASGETFTAKDMTAAHRDWPFGTWVEVSNPENGRVVAVRINDRGPWDPECLPKLCPHPTRDLDLSEAAARQLGMIEAGVVELQARVLSWGEVAVLR